jgi:hypothetical protein
MVVVAELGDEREGQIEAVAQSKEITVVHARGEERRDCRWLRAQVGATELGGVLISKA